MKMLFIHGAGGYDEDSDLAHSLAAALAAELIMPVMPSEDMSYGAWAAVVEQHLADLESGDVLIGHSFGASIVVGVLSHPDEGATYPSGIRVALLAMPDWGDAGWSVNQYAITGPEPLQRISLHHSRDDEVVPFAHLRANSRRLPSAKVHEYGSGGHQFDGQIARIAASL